MKKLLGFLFLILILATAGYLLQQYYHIFDQPIKDLDRYLALANGMFLRQLITGVSAGTALFVVILLVFPLLTRNIDTRAYFMNVRHGIVSSFVFFVSQAIYNYFEKINKFYLFLSMVVVVLVTFVLIQLFAGMFKKEEERVTFRTGHIACITAGIIFGILLKLSMVGVDYLKAMVPSLKL